VKPPRSWALTPGAGGSDLLIVDDVITGSTCAPVAPRGAIPPDSYSSIQQHILDAVKNRHTILLNQKPGFGKTRTIFNLLCAENFLVIFVPTKALKEQV
jgi:hypothetical protein